MKTFIDSKLAWALLLAAGLAFPWFAGNDYHLTVMSTAYIFAIATLGLNLITAFVASKARRWSSVWPPNVCR